MVRKTWIALSVVLLLLLIVQLAVAQTSDPTVYVTRTGTKYHNHGCRFLAKSSSAILLSEAVDAGYTPCSVCRPPAPKP